MHGNNFKVHYKPGKSSKRNACGLTPLKGRSGGNQTHDVKKVTRASCLNTLRPRLLDNRNRLASVDAHLKLVKL